MSHRTFSRVFFACVTLLTVALGGQVFAQSGSRSTGGFSGGGSSIGTGFGGGGGFASTASEGFLRGAAAVRQAQGQAAFNNGRALLAREQAREQLIRNQVSALQARVEAQRALNAYQQATAERAAARRERRVSPADVARYHQARVPNRLNNQAFDTRTGEIMWPMALQTRDFTVHRNRVEHLFAEWAQAEPGAKAAAIRTATSDLGSQLARGIRARTIAPQDAVAARRFIKGLAYEATRPQSHSEPNPQQHATPSFDEKMDMMVNIK